ncbi:putative cytochrome P450 reductase [Trypanosoma vivax]|nr:putative cytochrome P450 reductase [Trypanosoma vivax]
MPLCTVDRWTVPGRWGGLSAIIVSTVAFALALREWRRYRFRKALVRSLASKYADMLKERQEQPSACSNCEAQISVMYGSFSGNAEMYAKSLVAELRSRGAEVALADPSSWVCRTHCKPRHATSPLENEKTLVAVFVVATSGEGEPPDNFSSAFAMMREAACKTNKPYAGLLYAVFALGDSSYKYFCRAGVDVDSFVRIGGGVELLPIGFGDARDPMRDDVFEEWQELLVEKLVSVGIAPQSSVPEAPPSPQLLLRFTPDKPIEPFAYAPPPSLLEPSIRYPVHFVVVSKTQRTSKREDGSYILHLVAKFEGKMVSYQAGDHFGIYPVNNPAIVEAYRKALNIGEAEWSTPVELCTTVNARARASLRNTFPARVTLRTVFERYLDLCGKPRKSTLRVLARCCSDRREKEEFLDLLRAVDLANGSKLEQATGGLRTVLDYLRKFPSCSGSFGLEHFVEAMPRVQPRYYSIASDMLTHPSTVEIFVRIVPGGLNSTYLHNVSVGETVTAFVRKSSFHLPTKCGGRPVVMIGPGTGVASMIGFCHRRAALKKKQPATRHGPMVLFFGNRQRATEHFVQRELEEWCPHGEGQLPPAGITQDPVLTLSDVAFSRDQRERYYVTHLIEKHRDYLLQLLRTDANGGCLIYLSGNASHMARSVDRALLNLLEYGGWPKHAAAEFLARMERERRYLKDVY